MWNAAIKKISSLDRFLVAAVCITLGVLLPFISILPYLDGNIDFIQSYDFFIGRLPLVFAHWSSLHPPLKLVVVSGAFFLTGVNQYTYNAVGIFFMLIGIVGIYALAKDLFGTVTARIATLLFALCPLLLATSIFSLRDTLLAELCILALYYYLQKKYILYAFCASLVCLTKEPGVLLPLSIIGVEGIFDGYLFFSKRRFPSLIQYALLIVPLVIYGAWVLYLQHAGYSVWQDWIFAPTAKQGAVATIVWNIATFHILNKYAFQQWTQLFVLNFAWIYWLVAVGGLFFLSQKATRKALFQFSVAQEKTILVSFVFSVLYIVLVLSFQTYTIPRYATPIYPFLILAVSWCLFHIYEKSTRLFFLICCGFTLIVFLQLFTSVDPLSQKMWGTTQIFGQTLYNMPATLDGNDGITYNIQYLEIAKLRTEGIQHHQYTEPNWLFPDIRNDAKMMNILHIPYHE